MHNLPVIFNFDDVSILKALNSANSKLGELNGLIKAMPNPRIILNAVILGEAKESSEIENIVTTFDEIFRELVLKEDNYAGKEILNYRQAVLYGEEQVKKNGFINTNLIVDIHHIIEPNVGGIRKIPGTVIMNTKTKEIIHNPPQNEAEIRKYLSNLEKYINYPELEETDPLIKMAVIHFQFESIHPFHDGNGRTGRIINVLYLLLVNKLDMPILYLSKYINENRSEYYQTLNAVQKDITNLKEYLLFMIKGVELMSEFTINFINSFILKMNEADEYIRKRCPAIYSKQLVNYLFYDFYTRNEYLCQNLHVTRNTAGKYLNQLADEGILVVEKVGKNKIYKNTYLYDLMKNW